jgi:hypothetical protein
MKRACRLNPPILNFLVSFSFWGPQIGQILVHFCLFLPALGQAGPELENIAFYSDSALLFPTVDHLLIKLLFKVENKEGTCS